MFGLELCIQVITPSNVSCALSHEAIPAKTVVASGLTSYSNTLAPASVAHTLIIPVDMKTSKVEPTEPNCTESYAPHLCHE